MMPKFAFEHDLDLALMDGPHSYPFPELEYYYIYPHLRHGALLVLDNIEIPTIHHLFDVLCEDEMFELVSVIGGTTAFLRRTTVPTFSPTVDDWPRQSYNSRRYPVPYEPALVRAFMASWTAAGIKSKDLLLGLSSRIPPSARRRLARGLENVFVTMQG